MFVGSPVAEDDKVLIKIGKLLKKNNVTGHIMIALVSPLTAILIDRGACCDNGRYPW